MKPPKVWRTSYQCAYCRKKRGLQRPWEYRYEVSWTWRTYNISLWEWLGWTERKQVVYGGWFYHIQCKKAALLAQRLLR